MKISIQDKIVALTDYISDGRSYAPVLSPLGDSLTFQLYGESKRRYDHHASNGAELLESVPGCKIIKLSCSDGSKGRIDYIISLPPTIDSVQDLSRIARKKALDAATKILAEAESSAREEFMRAGLNGESLNAVMQNLRDGRTMAAQDPAARRGRY